MRDVRAEGWYVAGLGMGLFEDRKMGVLWKFGSMSVCFSIVAILDSRICLQIGGILIDY